MPDLTRTWVVDDLARCAYRAYSLAMKDAFKGKELGIPMPSWDDLSPRMRGLWREVAIAVWTDIWNLSAPPVTPKNP